MIQQYYENYLTKLGLQKGLSKGLGHFYTMNPAIGMGDFWLYIEEDDFVICQFDLQFHQFISIHYHAPSFLSIGLYHCAAIQRTKDREMVFTKGQQIIGYSGIKQNFSSHFHPNLRARCTSIALQPALAKRIAQQFDVRVSDLHDLFRYFNGAIYAPSVAQFFHQLKHFKPHNSIAKQYYESKICEVVALMLHEKTTVVHPEYNEINEALHYIHANIAQGINLQDIADHCAVSKSTLTTKFKAQTGLSIASYITEKRIILAQQALLHTNHSVAEIADYVGYPNVSSFIKRFKLELGITPLQFRTQNMQLCR